MIERAAFTLLCALVFTIPWEKSVTLFGAATLTRAAGLLAALAWAVVVLKRRTVRRTNLLLAAAAAFTAWSGLTWFWTLDPAATLGRFLTFVQLLVMTWIIWDLCRDRTREMWLMRMYIAGACIASAATVARYFLAQQTYYRRYAAPGFDPNDLGITVALALPLALYLSFRAGRAETWLFRGAVMLCEAAILLSASRTALVAAFLAFAVVLWLWTLLENAHKIAAAVLLLLLPAGVTALAPKASRQRISTIGAEISQGTLHNRTRIWKAGARVFKHHPILGIGAGAYPDAVRPELGVPGIPGHEYVAHNTFLSVLVETGAIGASVYGVFLLTAAAFIWVLPRTEQGLWATMLAVWVTGASLLTWEHRKPGWLLFALVMAAWARAFRTEPARTAVPE